MYAYSRVASAAFSHLGFGGREWCVCVRAAGYPVGGMLFTPFAARSGREREATCRGACFAQMRQISNLPRPERKTDFIYIEMCERRHSVDAIGARSRHPSAPPRLCVNCARLGARLIMEHDESGDEAITMNISQLHAHTKCVGQTHTDAHRRGQIDMNLAFVR